MNATDIVPEMTHNVRWKDVSKKTPQDPATDGPKDHESVHPPSFAQSEFETIIRRQKTHHHGLKIINIPSRFPTLDNDWEFAGWGSTEYLQLNSEDLEAAKRQMNLNFKHLDQFRVSSIAGNGVIGSVFYAFPVVAAAAGVFSPISLAVACLILFLWKPILLELGSAIPLNGANYTYLLQFSSKTLALVGAAATLLDAIVTSMVSAATATAYIGGEFASVPVSTPILSIIILLGITCIALFRTRDSTTLTLTITLIHLITMAILIIMSSVAWARTGSATLLANWSARPVGGSATARDIFYGICIGFLGASGFECTPAYIEMVSIKKYPSVIRNTLFSALILNAPLMLLVYVHLPSSQILHGSNILSLLADQVAGRWLRTLLVVDALLVLFGGVLTGLFTACGLLHTLAHDGVLPELFLRKIPLTGGPIVASLFFFLACVTMYATAAFKLSVISQVYTVAMLSVMILYTVSNILLKFNRNRLPRTHRASVFLTFLAFASIITVLVGNVALSPVTLGLFMGYFTVLLAGLLISKSQTKIARISIWLYGQSRVFQFFAFTRGLDNFFVRIIRQTQRNPICVWIKEDDIYHLVNSVLYVRKNEPTARIRFVHAYQNVDGIPSELSPNIKILDEAFPSITIDLVFVQGNFGPTLVQAVSKKMDIPRSRMLMSCFGTGHPYTLAQYKGLRIIDH